MWHRYNITRSIFIFYRSPFKHFFSRFLFSMIVIIGQVRPAGLSNLLFLFAALVDWSAAALHHWHFTLHSLLFALRWRNKKVNVNFVELWVQSTCENVMIGNKISQLSSMHRIFSISLYHHGMSLTSFTDVNFAFCTKPSTGGFKLHKLLLVFISELIKFTQIQLNVEKKNIFL